MSGTSPVDVNGNDLLNTAGALVNLPLAILLRAVASVSPAFSDLLSNSPAMQTKFGTGDRGGFAGAVFGDNSEINDDDKPGPSDAVQKGQPPGILGISMGLAHAEGIWGDAKVFEAGQLCHNLKTGGPEQKSDVMKSAGDTLGEGFGILAKHLGVGGPFRDLIVDAMGQDAGTYGFVQGVKNGTSENDSSTCALPKG